MSNHNLLQIWQIVNLLICGKKAWYNFALGIWTQIIFIKNNYLTISNEFSFPSCLFFHPTKIFKEKKSPNMIYSKKLKYHCTWMKTILSKFNIIECKISFFNNPKTLLPFVKQSKLFFLWIWKHIPTCNSCFHQLKGPFTIHMQTFTNTTTKCVVIHSGFHYILSEFGHFYLVKLFNPPVNGDQLTRISCYGQWIVSLVPNETRLFSSEIQIYQTIHLLIN